MCQSVADFIDSSLDNGVIPMALVDSDGLYMTTVPVSNEEGTFLACSDNPRARVVAALSGLHEMSVDLSCARSQ